jgi:hypothetical protein
MQMNPLTARALLDAWEAGHQQPWPQRALTMLSATDRETPLDTWAGLSVGERDRRLMLLREWAFGPVAQALVACVRCAARLEFEIDIAGMRQQPGGHSGGQQHVEIDGYRIAFRLPTSGDLASVAAWTDVNRAADALFARCLADVINADGAEHGAAASGPTLPPVVRAALIARMAAADPLADVRLDLRCPACHHEWQSPFDILRFFWTEVHAWAVLLMRDVHVLAAAYGWREADILAMTAWRRSIYLELAGA